MDLNELRRLAEAATPGPWHEHLLVIHPGARSPDGPTEQVSVVDSEHKDGKDFATVCGNTRHYICYFSCTRGTYELEEANAKFMVAARNTILALIDRIEKAERRVAELEGIENK